VDGELTAADAARFAESLKVDEPPTLSEGTAGSSNGMFDAKPDTPHQFGAPARRSRQVPPVFWAIALLLGVSAGVGLALLHIGRPSREVAAGSVASGPVLSWAAGSRRAPDFRLSGQDGQPISLNLFHGRAVIVTFIDPLCRNLCPVEAGVLNNVEKALPSTKRPAIVAVSVNPWGDARANLLEDDREWHLASNWRWAVGSPPQLRAVWRAYQIGVTVVNKEYAGVTTREISHTEAAFLIDPAGNQRALYLFPFRAADVARTLRQLGSSTTH